MVPLARYTLLQMTIKLLEAVIVNALIAYIVTPSALTNYYPFRTHFSLGNRIGSGGDKSQICGGHSKAVM
jgi:hypothetical protein